MGMMDRFQFKHAVIAVVLLGFGSSAVFSGQQRQSGHMIGHVVDSVGATIKGASVYVRGNTSSDAEVKLLTHTDINGVFTLELPDGGYDVLVTSPGFNAGVETVAISHGKPSKHQWTLKANDCSFPGMNCDTFQ